MNHDNKESKTAPVVAEVQNQPQVAPPQNAVEVPRPHKNHRMLFWLTVVVVVIAVICFLLWLFYFRFHESTDDAYVNGNMVNVTTVISGTPIAFYADDTDLVKEGQLLVRLDRTPYQIAFEKELSILASTVLQVRQLYDRVTEARAKVKDRRTVARKALYDYRNRKELVQSKAVSDEDFVHAKDDFLSARLSLKQAEAQLQMAIDAAGNTAVDKHPQIEAQKAVVRQAFYNLKHCEIYAPTTGYIAQRAVEVGQWVTATTFMMAIIPTDYIWIDANFKETQLSEMRIGQPATLTVDLYGSSVKFEGKVLGIASGTGSVFSIIPPQNATGNWIKIVQRLPVRISVDPKQLEKYPLRLGLSADVNVNISDTSGPMLAPVPSKKAIATTRVFELDLSVVEEQMDAIIRQQMDSEATLNHVKNS